MLLKIIRLPFRAALLPLIPVLLLMHLVCALLLGMSSIVTHLLSEVFLVGAVADWMTHARQEMIWQAVGSALSSLLLHTSWNGCSEGLWM